MTKITMELISGLASRAFWLVVGGVVFSEDGGGLVPQIGRAHV